MTDIPINVTISSKPAEDGERKVVRSLDNIKNKARETKGANQELDKSFRGIASGIATIDGPLGGIASRLTTVRGLINSTGFAVASFTVGLAAAGFAIRGAVGEATRFSTAMSEVRTLVNKDFAFKELTANIKGISNEFGRMPVEQAKAVYQIISAGASTAAEATNTLTVANKLSLGGVTEVAIAADGLTTVLNAYGDKVRSATSVSDAMFVAMRAGKTTIAELSGSIGKVAPIAAQVGVSFDELLASVSALTKGGISTAESVTGVRAILAAVAKPTQEASELAKQLGIDFSVAAIQTKGFAGFLEDLKTKTGGSTDQLALLFGGVEALVPAMALMGEAGKSFNEIMEQMGEKTGETEKAVNIMSETAQVAFDQLASKITTKAIDIGEAFLTVITPAVAAVAEHFDTLVGIVEIFIALAAGKLIVALVSSAAAAASSVIAWASLAAAISGTSAASVIATGVLTSLGNAAKATLAFLGPIGIAIAVVGTALVLHTNQAEEAQVRYNSAMDNFKELAGEMATANEDRAKEIKEKTDQIIADHIRELESLNKLVGAYDDALTSKNVFEKTLGTIGMMGAEVFGKLGIGDAPSELIDKQDRLRQTIKDMRELLEKPISGGAEGKGGLAGGLAGASKEAQKLAEARKQLLEQSAIELRQIQDINNADSVSEAMRDDRIDQIDVENELRKVGLEYGSKEAKQIQDNLSGIKAVEKALKGRAAARRDEIEAIKEQARQAEEAEEAMRKPFDNMVENLQRTFADTFADIYSGGVNSFGDLAKSVKNIFIRLAAELTALQFFGPQGISLSSFGGGGGSAASGLGFGNISDFLKMGQSSFLSGNFASAVDTFGLKNFGIGSFKEIAGPSLPGVYGPAPNGVGIEGGLSGAFNPLNIGAGMVGSFLSDKIFGSGMGTSIGSTLGSIAGGLAASAASGTAAAAALGAAAGPLGILAGALIGGGLGSLFNKKPSSKLQAGVVDFETGTITDREGLTGKKFSQENADAVTALSEVVASVTKSLGILEGSISVAVGGRNGFEYVMGEKIDEFFKGGTGGIRKSFDSVNQFVESFLGDLEVQFPDKFSAALSNAIDHVDWGTTQEQLQAALQDLSSAMVIEGIINPQTVETTTAYAESIKVINKQFDDLNEIGKRLKYSLEDLNKLEAARLDTLQAVKTSMTQGAINDFLSEVSPEALTAGNLRRAYEAQLKEFGAAGLDTSIIDMTYKIRQQKLLEQMQQEEISLIQSGAAERIKIIQDESNEASRLVSQYTSLSKSLAAAVNKLRLSEISPLSAEQRLSEARSLFQDTASRAALGDSAAMGELENIGNTFLALSRDYYASTDQFVQDFNAVESALVRARDVADRQLSIQQGILSASQAQIAAIQSSTEAIVAALLAKGSAVTTAGTSASVINSAVKVSASNANETLYKATSSGAYNYDANKSTIDALFNAVGAPAADNKGGRSAYLEANPAANAAFIKAAKAAGIPGFDKGGDVLANSVFMVGERRPEIYKSGSTGGRVIPLENGQNLEQRLIAVENEMKRATNVFYEGFKQMVAGQERQIESVEDQTRLTRKAL